MRPTIGAARNCCSTWSNAAAAAQPRRRVKMLPARQEVGVDGEGHGAHFVAQDGQRAAVHLLQRAAVDEFGGPS